MNNSKPIFVTQPFLPPLEEFLPCLEQIWKSHILTNNGPFHQELEQKLCEYLGVKYISLFSNGTLALVTALKALGISGEVITTPYSFVATTHALWWNNIKPVFVDIEPDTFNIDSKKIEAAISPQTSAILPVHVYGNPCNIDEVQRIAKLYGLKVIYDSAHAFGVSYNGTSIANFGDLSILSFHATKVFNTFEGGAIVCHDKNTKQRLDYLKNFGFADEITVIAPGINAKMNEIQASMGLLQLKYFKKQKKRREEIADFYLENLANISGLRFQPFYSNIEYNYGYFPILISEKDIGISRDYLYEKLKDFGIFARRYFYPLISSFPTYKELPTAKVNNLTMANTIASQVLCLPIYSDLSLNNAKRIVNAIKLIINIK